jgi:osmotically-inducible protein OsmY
MNNKFGRDSRYREDRIRHDDNYRGSSSRNDWRDPDQDRGLRGPDQEFETSGAYRQPEGDTWRDREGRFASAYGNSGHGSPSYGHYRGGAGFGGSSSSYDRSRYDGSYAPSYTSAPSADRMAREYRGGYSGRGPKGYTRTDDRIREDVCDRLSWNDEVDATDIVVRVEKGEVTLEGSVETRHMKRLAADISEDVSGVADVHNTIRVRKTMLTEIKENLLGENDDKHYANTGTKSTGGSAVRNGVT